MTSPNPGQAQTLATESGAPDPEHLHNAFAAGARVFLLTPR